MDGTSAETTHDLLLALAGWVDDDLLAWARELVAVDETRYALELLTATLVADRVELPAATRAALVDAGQSTRTELDADAALPPATVTSGARDTAHRFDGGAVEAVAEALRTLPARLLIDCRVSLARRLTPAGSAPGPLPHPVVVVEVTSGARIRDVLAYQLADALERVGIGASVEVLTAGAELPAYHSAAMRSAELVRSGEAGGSRPSPADRTAPSTGSSGGPPPRPVPVRGGTRSGAAASPVDGRTELPSEVDRSASVGPRQSDVDVSAARGSDSRPVPHPTEHSPRPTASPAQRGSAPVSNVRSLVQPTQPTGATESPASEQQVDEQQVNGQQANGHEHDDQQSNGRQSGPQPTDPAADQQTERAALPRGDQPALAELGYRRPTDASSGPADRASAVPPTELVPPPVRPVRHRYLIEPAGTARPGAERPETGRSETERPETGSDRNGSATDGTGSAQAVAPAPRPSIVGTQPLSARTPSATADDQQPHPQSRRASEGSPVEPEPVTAARAEAGEDERPTAADRSTRPHPTPAGGVARPGPAALDPLGGDLLRPDSMARLSASGRELLARLQAELRGGQQLGQRTGGLTTNGGGTGTGPQRKIDPPDLAG